MSALASLWRTLCLQTSYSHAAVTLWKTPYSRISRKPELSIYTVIYICIYKQVHLKSKLFNSLERDRQHDRPAACVIAQQYSSAIFVLLRFHSRKKKKVWRAIKNGFKSIYLLFL